jgi:hypothetical protein
MAQASSSVLTENLTVAGTCTSRPFTTVYRFDAPGRAWVQEVVRLAERTVGSRGSSPGVAQLAPPPNPEVFQPEAGAPIEVSLTFSQGLGNGSFGPPPDFGAASLALYEWVGPDDYPYPDPPAALVQLKPLNLTPDQSVALVSSDPEDPAAERTVTFFWPPIPPPTESLSVEMRAQTPGVLRVLLDGTEVSRGYWWDYGQDFTWSSANLHLPILNRLAVRGDRIDLNVIPERMTGAWAVALYNDTAADR